MTSAAHDNQSSEAEFIHSSGSTMLPVRIRSSTSSVSIAAKGDTDSSRSSVEPRWRSVSYTRCRNKPSLYTKSYSLLVNMYGSYINLSLYVCLGTLRHTGLLYKKKTMRNCACKVECKIGFSMGPHGWPRLTNCW